MFFLNLIHYQWQCNNTSSLSLISTKLIVKIYLLRFFLPHTMNWNFPGIAFNEFIADKFKTTFFLMFDRFWKITNLGFLNRKENLTFEYAEHIPELISHQLQYEEPTQARF